MVESGERSFTPITRIQRHPAYLGARLLLAAIMAGGTACASETASRTVRLRCPETATEVSFLVGGDPRYWSPIASNKGAWYFDGPDDSTVFNWARVGRVDIPGHGRLSPLNSDLKSKTAWYVCPENLSLPVQDSVLAPTPEAE